MFAFAQSLWALNGQLWPNHRTPPFQTMTHSNMTIFIEHVTPLMIWEFESCTKRIILLTLLFFRKSSSWRTDYILNNILICFQNTLGATLKWKYSHNCADDTAGTVSVFFLGRVSDQVAFRQEFPSASCSTSLQHLSTPASAARSVTRR